MSDDLKTMIDEACSEITRRAYGHFYAHVARLEHPLAKFSIKTLRQPLSEFSMVPYAHRYLLCRGFENVQMIDKCAMLIHESVHDLQHQQMGSVRFFAKYATFQGRYELELEAFKAEFLWYWAIGWLMHPTRLYAFADHMVEKYRKNYVNLWWFNDGRKKAMKQELLKIVDYHPNV